MKREYIFFNRVSWSKMSWSWWYILVQKAHYSCAKVVPFLRYDWRWLKTSLFELGDTNIFFSLKF